MQDRIFLYFKICAKSLLFFFFIFRDLGIGTSAYRFPVNKLSHIRIPKYQIPGIIQGFTNFHLICFVIFFSFWAFTRCRLTTIFLIIFISIFFTFNLISAEFIFLFYLISFYLLLFYFWLEKSFTTKKNIKHCAIYTFEIPFWPPSAPILLPESHMTGSLLM